MPVRRITKGFTLAEVLIVVAIIAVLVGISIPTFTAQTAKAKAAADMANVRSAKSVAAAQFMTDLPSTSTTYYYDAASGQVKNSPSGITGYGQSNVAVDGALGIPNTNGVAAIVSVTCDSAGTISASWSSGETENILQKNQTLANNYTGNAWQLNDYLKSNGSTLTVDTSSLFGTIKIQNDPAQLTWRPVVATINGVKTVILYANDSSNTSAFAIYYNGTTYLSTNNGGYQGRINRNAISSFNVDSSGNVSGNWKKK